VLAVNYTISGTANNTIDYQTLSGTVVVGANQSSATIPVTPIDDSAIEGDETVIVTLAANAAYTLGAQTSATVTIADDDAPVVTILASDPGAAEAGLDPGTFTVSRTGNLSADLIVSYSIAGSAANATDYQSLSGSVTIAAGQPSAIITVTPIDDTIAEGSETVILTLTASAGYTIGIPNSATVTITDNDGPTITISPSFSLRGNSLTATWSGLISPSPTDWIGLYTVGAPNLPFWAWEYVSCTTTATSARASGSCSLQIPINVPPGAVEVRLFSNNGFTKLATSNPLTVH
jgi:hypothetical protein